MWLFDTSRYVPRQACGDWPGALMWADHIGNILVASAYFVIPILLMIGLKWFGRKNEWTQEDTNTWTSTSGALSHIPWWVIPSFALFIFFCAIGHLFGILVFYWPGYRLFIVWNVGTGLVSWLAVAGLWFAAKRLSTWVSPQKYARVSQERDCALKKLQMRAENAETELERAKKEIADMKGKKFTTKEYDSLILRLEKVAHPDETHHTLRFARGGNDRPTARPATAGRKGISGNGRHRSFYLAP